MHINYYKRDYTQRYNFTYSLMIVDTIKTSRGSENVLNDTLNFEIIVGKQILRKIY